MLSPYRLLQLVLGLTIWSTWFVVTYGGLSVGCVLSPPAPEQGPFNWLNLAIGTWTFLVAALLLFLFWRCFRACRREQAGRDRQFVAAVGAGIHLAGFIATLTVGMPLLLMTPCL